MSYSIEGDEQERKLYVGGLNRDSTDEDVLRHYFESYGKVVDINIMRDHERRSRGFGFVLFADADSIDKIMSAKREGADFVLDNNSLQIKRALPKVPGGKAVSPRLDYRKVFVGGLPNVITEDDLQNYFEKFGRVNQVELLRDRETNRLRGYAFVTFEDEDVADKCIQRRSHEICKKVCEVKRATNKSRDDGPGQSGRAGMIDNHEHKIHNQVPNGVHPSGILPVEEVNRLIQQAFVMGQQSVQSGMQANVAAASLLGGLGTPLPANNNILLQALLNQQRVPAPVPIAPVVPLPQAPVPASTLAPSGGVTQIAQLLQNSGVDANTLAALLKGDTQPTETSPPSYSTSYPSSTSYNYTYDDKSSKYGSNKEDARRRYNPY